MELVTYLDTISVFCSLLLLIAYHAYLWYVLKTKPSRTTFGVESIRRRICFLEIKESDGKNAMIAVQILRNTQMVAIFTASTAITFTLALAALTNNAYKARHLFVETAFFGSQSGRTFALKFGLAALVLLSSSLCSSMATGIMIDAIFLINASAKFSSSGITDILLEQGYMLAFIGNRLLCISLPLLLWLFGPVPVALSSLVLVWWLKQLDFNCCQIHHTK